ncbi:Uncharacterised protein [Capnocytophaga canimorsus]|nr:hypothetical protein CLV61_1725 [Capnocytophaga canimorsus]STA71439.1 Uncharacterised protein [Capnocytophaga canimorsus]
MLVFNGYSNDKKTSNFYNLLFNFYFDKEYL